MNISKIHHIAIICSNYQVSKSFYTKILGFKILNEHFRQDRKSYKLDLAINELYQIELFSFPNPPKRASYPEACGLRHFALEVNNLDKVLKHLNSCNVPYEKIRKDEFTNKRFTFISDPDGLPIELYEC